MSNHGRPLAAVLFLGRILLGFCFLNLRFLMGRRLRCALHRLHPRDHLHLIVGRTLQLGDAVVVGLDRRLGRSDLLAGGGIGRLRGGTLLRVVQLTQLDVRLFDGVLLAHVGGL